MIFKKGPGTEAETMEDPAYYPAPKFMLSHLPCRAQALLLRGGASYSGLGPATSISN